MNIEFSDSTEIAGLVPFLCEHFPRRDKTFWERSLRSISRKKLSGKTVGPPIAAVLYEQGQIVACILILQKDTSAVSLSSWAVRADRGSVGYPFLRAVINRLAQYDIYNHSAVPGVDKLMELVGFEYIRSCAIPLPNAKAFLTAIRPFAVRSLGDNLYSATFDSGTVLTFKRLSILRNGRFRRLVLLLECSDPVQSCNAVSTWCAWCLLRGLFPILAAPDYGFKVIHIKKFGTLRRKGEKRLDDTVIPWHDTYSRSEFAMMDF